MEKSLSALRNHSQLHRTLDILKGNGVIHGWGRDCLTCRYTVALEPTGSEEDHCSGLTIGDVWILIGPLRS